MGAQLQALLDKALQPYQKDPKQLGVMKVRLIMKIGVSTNQISTVPDSPELIERLKKSAQDLGIKL